MAGFGAGRAGRAGALIAVMAAAWGVRLALGLRTQLDADEATNALAAYEVLHGQFVVMEPNLHYLGGLEVYVLTPFVAAFGNTLLAVRIAMASVGACLALAAYWLGREIFRSHPRALLLALATAVIPLFSTYWSAKARGGYAESLPLEVAALAFAAAVGWHRRAAWWLWAALGVSVGLCLWNDLVSLPVVAVIALMLLLRGPSLGWARWLGGVATALAGAVVGFSPWLFYNLRHNFASIANLPVIPTPMGAKASALLTSELPIFSGGSQTCSMNVVPVWLSDAVVIALFLAILWSRRHTVLALLRGHAGAASPADMVLLVGPAVVAGTVVTNVQLVACEPRYLLLLGPPMALATIMLLVLGGRASRLIVAVALTGWLVVSGITADGQLPEQRSVTTTVGLVPFDLGPGIAMLEAAHPQGVYAQYWLARPLQYYSGTALKVAEFGGPVGFPVLQLEADSVPDPSWVFPVTDRDIPLFVAYCAQHGISYTRISGGGLVLFTALSAPVEPSQLGFS